MTFMVFFFCMLGKNSIFAVRMKVARLIVGKRIWMKFRLMQGVFLFLQIERCSTQREFQLPWWGTFSFVFFPFGCNTIHHCNIVMSDADVYIGGMACNFPFHSPVTPGVKPVRRVCPVPVTGASPATYALPLLVSSISRSSPLCLRCRRFRGGRNGRGRRVGILFLCVRR